MNDDELRSALGRRAAGQLSADERNDVLRAARISATAAPARRSFAPRLASLLVGAVAVVVLALIALPILLSPPGPARPTSSPGVTVLTQQQLIDLANSGWAVGRVVIADATIVASDPVPACDPGIPCPIGVLGTEGGFPVTGGYRDSDPATGTPVAFEVGNGDFNRWITPLTPPKGDQRSAFLILDTSVEYLGPAEIAADGGPLHISDLPLDSEKTPTDNVYVVHGWWWSGMWPNCPAQPQSTFPPLELDYYCNGFWLTPNRPETTSTTSAPQDALLLAAGEYPAWSDQHSPGAPVEGTYVVRSAGCQITLDNRCPVWRMLGKLDDSAPRQSPPPADSLPPDRPVPSLLTASSSPNACMAALIQGYLEPDPNSGLGILALSGGNNYDQLQSVQWPSGYSAAYDGNRLSLLDGHGNVVARVGDFVSVSGGFVNNIWFADCGDIKVIAAPSPSSSPAAALPIANPQKLADMIGDPQWVGKTVLANVALAAVDAPGSCVPIQPCFEAVLRDVDGSPQVMIGWRDATAQDGVMYDDGSGYRWVKLLATPGEEGVFAFKVGHDSVEYLGPAATSVNGQPMLVPDLAGSQSQPSDDVFVVSGWLTQSPSAPCAFPAQGLETPMPDISSYYCGGSWLTAASLPMPSSGLTYDGGLHVQNDAYMTFADEPLPSGGNAFAGPIYGTFLIRNAGCPEVVTGDCPVWRMVGRLDDGSQSPSATPIPADGPTPAPSATPYQAPATPISEPSFAASDVSYVHLDQAVEIAKAAATTSDDPKSYAGGPIADVVQSLFGPSMSQLVTTPPNTDMRTLVWAFVFAAKDQTKTVYVDLLDGSVLFVDDENHSSILRNHQSDFQFVPPLVVVQNGTTLDLTIYVNDQPVSLDNGNHFDPRSYGSAPWIISARTSTGREIASGTLKPEGLWAESGDVPIGESGWLARADLSCGRFQMWAGFQPSGPVPFGSYPPGDCDP